MFQENMNLRLSLTYKYRLLFLVYITFFLWDQIYALSDADIIFQLWRAADQLLTAACQSWIIF